MTTEPRSESKFLVFAIPRENALKLGKPRNWGEIESAFLGFSARSQ